MRAGGFGFGLGFAGRLVARDQTPAWVASGAVLDLDFQNGRYWSAAQGLVSAADVLDGNIDWWLGFDGPDQLLDIVPGVGLTTGATTSGYSVHGVPFLTSTAFAEVTAEGGFALAGTVTGSSDSPLAGFNSWAAYIVMANNPAYNPVADAWIGVNASGGKAQFGDNWTTYSVETNPTAPLSFAVNFDIATDKWTGAVNGDPMNALDGTTNMATANSIGIGASAGGTGNSVTSTVPRMTFYRQKSQAELNALSGA